MTERLDFRNAAEEAAKSSDRSTDSWWKGYHAGRLSTLTYLDGRLRATTLHDETKREDANWFATIYVERDGHNCVVCPMTERVHFLHDWWAEQIGLFRSRCACSCGWRGPSHITPTGIWAIQRDWEDHMRDDSFPRCLPR